jgi:hypothetical protein
MEMKIAIVGTKFRPGGIAALAKIQKGHALVLVREPDNQHDPDAVAIYSAAGEHLGYVPRSENIDLARDLDAGVSFATIMEDEAIIAKGEIKFAPKIVITRKA